MQINDIGALPITDNAYMKMYNTRTDPYTLIIRSLFDAFLNDPLLLPPEQQQHVNLLENTGADSGRARGIADYIAGMTDRYAIREYERIFNATELT